jgi:hypothetical protein
MILTSCFRYQTTTTCRDLELGMDLTTMYYALEAGLR